MLPSPLLTGGLQVRILFAEPNYLSAKFSASGLTAGRRVRSRNGQYLRTWPLSGIANRPAHLPRARCPRPFKVNLSASPQWGALLVNCAPIPETQRCGTGQSPCRLARRINTMSGLALCRASFPARVLRKGLMCGFRFIRRRSVRRGKDREAMARATTDSGAAHDDCLYLLKTDQHHYEPARLIWKRSTGIRFRDV